MFLGLAPADVIVIVFVLTGGPDGCVGVLSPQVAASTPTVTITQSPELKRVAGIGSL
jgi:hypothetical protein